MMNTFKDIPKDLPFWKYSLYHSDVPYWEYRLGEDADLHRFVVFDGVDGLNRSWFITDYVVPCNQTGDRLYTAVEVANPAIKPVLALVVIRKEQGSKIAIGLVLDHDFAHPDPILVAADEIGLQDSMLQQYHNMRNYRAVESFERLIKEKYNKYLEATERQLMGS